MTLRDFSISNGFKWLFVGYLLTIEIFSFIISLFQNNCQSLLVFHKLSCFIAKQAIVFCLS